MAFASQSPREIIPEVDQLAVLVLHKMIEEERELREGKVFFNPAQAFALRCLYRYSSIVYQNSSAEDLLYEEFERIYDGIQNFFHPLPSALPEML